MINEICCQMKQIYFEIGLFESPVYSALNSMNSK